MENVTIGQGLQLTIIAMLLVFVVLAGLWGAIELVHKFFGESAEEKPAQGAAPAPVQSVIQADPQRQKAAEIIAVIQAYEENPSENYEVVKTERIS